MRCFCCDLDVGDSGLDVKTGRYYCSECIEPANQEALRQRDPDFIEDAYQKVVELFPDELEETEGLTDDEAVEYAGGLVRTHFENKDYFGYTEDDL